MPPGAGKSRVAAAVALYHLLLNTDSVVHFVYSTDHLRARDNSSFQNLWSLTDLSARVQTHTSMDFEKRERDLLLIDEADDLLYSNPKEFLEKVKDNTFILFTATSSDTKNYEESILKMFGVLKVQTEETMTP